MSEHTIILPEYVRIVYSESDITATWKENISTLCTKFRDHGIEASGFLDPRLVAPVAATLVAFHVAPDAERLTAVGIWALEWFLASVGMAVYAE